jgi:hypothetical protein
MNRPTREILEAICANQDIALPDDLLAGALEGHRVLRPGLEELRRVPLPYIGMVEPATATAWIENGGRS